MSEQLRDKNLRWTPWLLLGIAVFFAAALTWITRPDALDHVEIATPDSNQIPRHELGEVELMAAASEPTASSDLVAAPAVKANTRTSSGPPRARTERWSEGVITGRVLGGPGASEPIADILVRAGSPRSTFPIPPLTTRTDRDGRYEFRELVGAFWEIDAWLTDIDRRGASTVELSEEDMPTAEVDVLLAYDRHVLVRLVDVRGRSITADALGIDPQYANLLGVGISTRCKDHGAPMRPKEMVTSRVVDKSPEGERHTFDVVIQGVGAECVLALFSGHVLASRKVSRDDASIELVIDPRDMVRLLGSCTVEVVRAADGVPIETGKVTFRPPAVQIVRDLGRGGSASALGVPIGAIDIEVEVPGYGLRVMRVRVPMDEPVRVEMQPARSLTGTIAIVGEGSVGSLKPAVWLIRDPKARLDSLRMIPGRRPVANSFAFEKLEPGVYVLAAVPSAVSALTAADVRAGHAVGATWVDLTDDETIDVRLDVPDWLTKP